jgi:hypothetical protein
MLEQNGREIQLKSAQSFTASDIQVWSRRARSGRLAPAAGSPIWGGAGVSAPLGGTLMNRGGLSSPPRTSHQSHRRALSLSESASSEIRGRAGPGSGHGRPVARAWGGAVSSFRPGGAAPLGNMRCGRGCRLSRSQYVPRNLGDVKLLVGKCCRHRSCVCQRHRPSFTSIPTQWVIQLRSGLATQRTTLRNASRNAAIQSAFSLVAGSVHLARAGHRLPGPTPPLVPPDRRGPRASSG